MTMYKTKNKITFLEISSVFCTVGQLSNIVFNHTVCILIMALNPMGIIYGKTVTHIKIVHLRGHQHILTNFSKTTHQVVKFG